MSKGLLILLLPIALAGCAVGHIKLPMTIGPSDTPKASCLTYADAPAFGDCKGAGEVIHSPRDEIGPAWSARGLSARAPKSFFRRG
jgi:hypothetical protein